MVALVVAVVLVAVLFFGGDGSIKYKLRFQTAGQLVHGDDVQVAGRRIGSVVGIDLTDNNQAEITVKIEKPYAPLHEGTTAIQRLTSLSGVANRYIALTLGPNSAPRLAPGSTIATDKTTTVVDLDQLFNTLDAKTRKGLTNVIKGFATQYKGQERNANRSAKYFGASLSTTQQLINEILRDQAGFQRFLTQTSAFVTTLAARAPELTQLVSNTNTTMQAIGDQNAALDETLARLPETLRKGNTTFVNLRATLDDVTKLVDASKPATKHLARFMRELRPLVAAGTPTFRDLRYLAHAPGPDNDATDALRLVPKLQRVSKPAFEANVESLEKGLPVLQFIRPYAPELVGFFRDFGQSTANYDANGHYARVQPIANLFKLNSEGQLDPISPDDRYDGMITGQSRRCPGSAGAAPADGSAPFTDGGKLDCDPKQVPPQ